jgi:teichuronic acid biosynthesis glycosyltransferase TuaC
VGVNKEARFARAGFNTLPAVRVEIVTHMWPSESHPESGVFVRDQVEALRRRGVEVEVASFPRGGTAYLAAARKLRRERRRSRADVTHAHYGLSGWSSLAGGLPELVVTFHGTDLRHRVVGPLSRLLARFVTLPAVVSASLAREALPGAGTRRRVAVLPCGVDIDRFRPLERREARSRLGLDPAAPYLLFPADPERESKRHDRARLLAAHLPGVELLALRGVAPSEVPLWVNAANAVVVSSEREGFGLAALEALACDVPVLSTPVGIAPVALAGIRDTLCEPFEEQRWLSVARPLVEAPDPRVQGRARAELFSSDRMAERVLVVYRELVA